MSLDYQKVISNLKKALPFLISIVIIEERVKIVYSTNNWDIKPDLNRIPSFWTSLKEKFIEISGKKYLIRISTSDRLVATSIRKDGHIVGVKDDTRIMISHIEPDGIIPFTTMEMARALASLSMKKPYADDNIQFGQKAKAMGVGTPEIADVRAKMQNMNEEDVGVHFTARLMAYYRAQENKHISPLIRDPFAELLAGDLSLYLKNHVRISQMDYPIVRSHYIEKNLLTHWCNTQKKSQIVLLGAGLDTRAYRFKPILINKHTIIEVDFPSIIHYKERILQKEKPLCDLVRLPLDLLNEDWSSYLIKGGFSRNIPTFWVLEGLAYYIEKERFRSLITKAAEISIENSQIFVDILQVSRWYPFYFNDSLLGPFSKHFKWGLDIKFVPSLFKFAGWNVSCSFADKYDQGRDVGQKGMIFIHGIRAKNINLS